jgi:hypothetical protein
MEDIMKIKTGWGTAIMSKIITAALNKAGYDVTISINDFEAVNEDNGDEVVASVNAVVKMDKKTIVKLLK